MILVLAALVFSYNEPLPFPKQPDIYLEIVEHPRFRKELYFFAPHENENVVNEYLKEQVLRRGGRFVILHQHGERNLQLKFGDKIYMVDPNRIFSKHGVVASLQGLNEGFTPQDKMFRKACQRALRIGKFIRKRLGRVRSGRTIIAIHNNTDGYDNDGKGGVGTLSIERYRKRFKSGALYIKDVHVGEDDEDDLFFVTDPRDFDNMKADGWNALLQHPQVAWIDDEDDGSLSVLSEKRGVRYINIEAQRKEGDNHLEVQKKMVDYVYDLLGY
jgi:hypothetical protein